MTKSVNGDLRIFTGNANPALAQKICEHLNMDLGKLRVEKFADGEIDVQILLYYSAYLPARERKLNGTAHYD